MADVDQGELERLDSALRLAESALEEALEAAENLGSFDHRFDVPRALGGARGSLATHARRWTRRGRAADPSRGPATSRPPGPRPSRYFWRTGKFSKKSGNVPSSPMPMSANVQIAYVRAL